MTNFLKIERAIHIAVSLFIISTVIRTVSGGLL